MFGGKKADLVDCPGCHKLIEAGSTSCPHCGHGLGLRKEREREVGQNLRDMNKFVWVALGFILLLIPLGMCIKPD